MKKGFRVQGIGYRLIPLILLLVFFLTPTPYTLNPAQAQEATSSADSLKSKINALKIEIASKAALLKLEVNKKLQNKAIYGTIKEKSGNNLTISTNKLTRNIITNEYTIFEDTANFKKSFSIKDISEGDQIVALGDIDDKNNLTTKKLIRVTREKTNLPQAFWGEIIRVSNNNLTIKLKSKENITLKTDANTVFRLGNEEASILDAKINMFAVAIKESSESGQVRFVYIIPSGSNIKSEKSASPSSSPVKK